MILIFGQQLPYIKTFELFRFEGKLFFCFRLFIDELAADFVDFFNRSLSLLHLRDVFIQSFLALFTVTDGSFFKLYYGGITGFYIYLGNDVLGEIENMLQAARRKIE